MSSLVVALLVFVATACGGLAGLLLSKRLLPQHRDPDSRSVVQLVMGLIASVAAIVLGLLISSAHSSFDAQEAEVRHLGIHLFEINRILGEYGQETTDARGLLRRIVMADMKRIWPDGEELSSSFQPLQAQIEGKELIDRIANLVPKTAAQRFNQARALQLAATLGDTRLLLGEQARGSLSWPFLVVMVFWLAVLFVGFGLFARFNPTTFVALLVGALSVGGAVFLILEMNQPYRGVMRLSDAPIRDALSQMAP